MGVEPRLCQRSAVGFWWITQSQPELSLQCADLGQKGKISIACFPEPPTFFFGEQCWCEHLQYSHTGCSRLHSVQSALLQGGVDSNGSLQKHEMVFLEQLHGPPSCAPTDSPIQQCGIPTSSLSPAMTGRRCPHTWHTQWCRRGHPKGSHGSTFVGSWDQAGDVTES